MGAHLNVHGVKDDDGNAYTTAKVWLNYNQNGNSITNDYNVSTVGDEACGLWLVNFSEDLGAADFATSINAVEDSAGSHDMTMDRRANPTRTATTVSLIKCATDNTSGSCRDVARNSLIIFGD